MKRMNPAMRVTRAAARAEASKAAAKAESEAEVEAAKAESEAEAQAQATAQSESDAESDAESVPKKAGGTGNTPVKPSKKKKAEEEEGKNKQAQKAKAGAGGPASDRGGSDDDSDEELIGLLAPSHLAASKVKVCTWPRRIPTADGSPVSDLDDNSDVESEDADDIRLRCIQWAHCRADVIVLDRACMERQTDINRKFRAILVDWLVEVAVKFKLLEKTVFITVAILDKYLSTSKLVIARNNLQLVGMASLLLACKFEEIYAPCVRDMVHVSARAYTRDEILAMETKIYTKLGGQLPHVTAWTFLSAALVLNVNFDPKKEDTARYFITRMLQEFDMMSSYSPSLLAHSAIMLTSIVCGKRDKWEECVHRKPDCVLFSPHHLVDLYECATLMNDIIASAPKQQLVAVVKLFTCKYGGVADTKWLAACTQRM